MPRLEVFEIEGLVLVFYSNDHDPPHFHVKRRGEWELRIFFLECTEDHLASEEVFSKRGCSMGAKHRRTLCRLIDGHRGELLREWERKVITDE